MAKTISIIASVLLLTILSAGQAFSQTCWATFIIDDVYIDRGDGAEVEIPVWFSNTCSVGGLAIQFDLSPANIFNFVDIDYDGGSIEYWDYLQDNLLQGNPSHLKMVGIANLDDPYTSPLPPGENVLLCTIRLRFSCTYYTNTIAYIGVNMDSSSISDSSGYHVFEHIAADAGVLQIGSDLAIRGDSNCSGQLLGSDVTYLVNYFRGLGYCPCSRCAGDANGDGNIIGSDVTYLVRYFTGAGAPPPPCDGR